MKKAELEFRQGDVVRWCGHLSGLADVTMVFGIILKVTEDSLTLRAPALTKNQYGDYEISTVERKYSQALFRRLSPKVLKRLR